MTVREPHLRKLDDTRVRVNQWCCEDDMGALNTTDDGPPAGCQPSVIEVMDTSYSRATPPLTPLSACRHIRLTRLKRRQACVVGSSAAKAAPASASMTSGGRCGTMACRIAVLTSLKICDIGPGRPVQTPA